MFIYKKDRLSGVTSFSCSRREDSQIGTEKGKFFPLKTGQVSVGCSTIYTVFFFRKSFKFAIIGTAHASTFSRDHDHFLLTFSSHIYFQPFFQSPGNRESVASRMQGKFKSRAQNPSIRVEKKKFVSVPLG